MTPHARTDSTAFYLFLAAYFKRQVPKGPISISQVVNAIASHESVKHGFADNS